jgi:hypothetical protein
MSFIVRMIDNTHISSWINAMVSNPMEKINKSLSTTTLSNVITKPLVIGFHLVEHYFKSSNVKDIIYDGLYVYGFYIFASSSYVIYKTIITSALVGMGIVSGFYNSETVIDFTDTIKDNEELDLPSNFGRLQIVKPKKNFDVVIRIFDKEGNIINDAFQSMIDFKIKSLKSDTIKGSISTTNITD